VVERNVRTTKTTEELCRRSPDAITRAAAAWRRRNAARNLRVRWWRRSARLRAARRKRNLETVSHIVLQSNY
jgi:hypothetical protein